MWNEIRCTGYGMRKKPYTKTKTPQHNVGKSLGINCFTNPRIFSNHKINPARYAINRLLVVTIGLLLSQAYAPSVFIHFKAVSCFFCSKKLPPNLVDFFSMENLNKGSKGWRPSIIPGTYQWIIFCRRWNALIFGLAMVVLSRFPVRTGLTGGLGGAVWGSCDGDVVVGSQPFEGNKHKENNTREKGFQRLASFRCTEKTFGSAWK